jgi:hypothetical protein
MSYAHCHLCQHAFDLSKHRGCPGCGVTPVAEAPPIESVPRTLAMIASEFAAALQVASAAELADVQADMREHAAVAEAIAMTRKRIEETAHAIEPKVTTFARGLIIATIEAATMRLVAHARDAGNSQPKSNVVDLYPSNARLEAAQRWVAQLAA